MTGLRRYRIGESGRRRNRRRERHWRPWWFGRRNRFGTRRYRFGFGDRGFNPVIIRVEGVEIFAVEMLRGNAETFAETLIVYDFPLAQEAYNIFYIGVVNKTQDIVVGCAGFLFCRDITSATMKGLNRAVKTSKISRWEAPLSRRPSCLR
jgi:hypothetical protein